MKKKQQKKDAVHHAAKMMIITCNQCYPRGDNPWKHLEAHQVLRDCLECLKQQKLINDYNLKTGEIS